MKLKIVYSALAILAAAAPALPPAAFAAPAQERPADAAKAELLAAIEHYKQAVIAKDRAGLERVFNEDLSYGHSTGEVLNKSQSIERTLAAPQTYTAIEQSDVVIQLHGHFAIVTARTDFHFTKDGAQTVAKLANLDVWVKEKGGWQLLARQLTRPAS